MASASRRQQTSHSQKLTVDNNSRYECSICLCEARDPVVLTCGHFYCWKCINNWLSRRGRCPVCNCIIDPSKDVIPIYGQGLTEKEPLAKQRPQPKVERREQAGLQRAGSNQNSSSDEGLDTLFKVGLGILGGAVLGAVLHSIFGGRSSRSVNFVF
ncbi:RING finger protein 5 [Toxocara canis]|uniref:RING-type E3 ubiquitin transferase n=1 Tax=Toxocara canis TaxID=6265 RepID=A0A0B2VAK0_TOXCA|nr:RING finger protein 5 [Toxocara canis]